MKYLIVIGFVLFGWNSFNQELNCEVSVISSPALQVGSVDKEIFTELEGSIYDFMNNTRWTKDIYEIEERINVSILITITEIPSTSTYSGKIQIQSTRPVFNSAYNTVLFNFVDNNFSVSYARNTALLFSIDQHRDNLTSILAFYAYMVIAYDYDSFSEEGGTQYFTKAQIIANNAKNSGDAGWSAAGKKNNRYWMVDAVLWSHGVDVNELRRHLGDAEIVDSGYILHLVQKGASKGRTLTMLLHHIADWTAPLWLDR